MTVLLVPVTLVLWQRRVPVNRALQARGVDALMYAMVALYLIGWVYKIVAMGERNPENHKEESLRNFRSGSHRSHTGHGWNSRGADNQLYAG